MKLSRKISITAVSAVMLISSVSCFVDDDFFTVESYKSGAEIEAELEKKYNKNFNFISNRENKGREVKDEDGRKKIEGANMAYHFNDDEGLVFDVTGSKYSSGKMGDSTRISYQDNYEEAYFTNHTGDFFKGFEDAGIEVDYIDYNLVNLKVNSYDQLDVLFSEVNKLREKILTDLKTNQSFISSSPDITNGRSWLSYHSGSAYLGTNVDKEEDIRKAYIAKIKNGYIDEKLPEGA